MGLAIVIFIRLLVPFSIPRWPLAGALISMAADTYDINILGWLGWGVLDAGSYQQLDKALDMYYLSFEFYVSQRWWPDVLARKTSLVFFLWRLAGFIAFEATQVRRFLVLGPNIFENFYLLITATRKLSPAFRVDKVWKLAVLIIISGVPKILQEYKKHF